jgi:methylated-DNA-[protein]-cysteine S-methyltransferase
MTSSTSSITLDSPLGPLELRAEGGQLTGLYFAAHRGRPESTRVSTPVQAAGAADRALLEAAGAQLAEYFAGRRQRFELPLAPHGTPFQRTVWQALAALPFGATVSYAELARRLGRPGAARAVGLANAKNPISIVLPCHRVIAASGALTGYAGGLPAKAWLLRHEGHTGSLQKEFAL